MIDTMHHERTSYVFLLSVLTIRLHDLSVAENMRSAPTLANDTFVSS
jgi:hypothetical protein